MVLFQSENELSWPIVLSIVVCFGLEYIAQVDECLIDKSYIFCFI